MAYNGLRMLADEDERAEEEDSPFNLDSSNLRQFVPAEVWTLVTDKLQERSSNDHQNLVNCSPFFQDLVARQRTIYLFEQVFQLVMLSVWKKEGLKGFPAKEVLNCRGVCKHWNAVIDKLIPEKFQRFGEDSRNDELKRIGYAFDRIQENYVFQYFDLERISPDGIRVPEEKKSVFNFLRHFETSHPPANQSKGRSPFITGKIEVVLYCEPDDGDEDERQLLQRLLEGLRLMISKYGCHITSFELFIDSYQYLLQNPLVAEKWLWQMPNLKEFEFSHGDDDVDVDDDNFLEVVSRELTLPKLRFLERIHFGSLAQSTFSQFIQINNHVSTLQLNWDGELNYSDIFSVAFPNLKKLLVGGVTNDFVEGLGSPQTEWAPLDLYLEGLDEDSINLDYETINCEYLFQVIQNKFSATLVSLTLILPGDQVWEPFKNGRLDLPKVREIWLQVHVFPACLDFLLPMKNNLEEISASCYCPKKSTKVEETSRAIVQFFEFDEKMYESNVWTIFENLKKFKVIGGRDYYRKEWMLKNKTA